jgi:rhamnosyltransferase
MRSGKSKLILAVVVTYNPNIDELLRLIKALIHQVSHIVIVDNGSAVDVKSFLINRNDTSVHFLPLNNNLGIATAQNAGIAWAREHKADYVVLFDQDSEPATDMIERLLEATESMVSQGYKVGAVGIRLTSLWFAITCGFVALGTLELRRNAKEHTANGYVA